MTEALVQAPAATPTDDVAMTLDNPKRRVVYRALQHYLTAVERGRKVDATLGISTAEHLARKNITIQLIRDLYRGEDGDEMPPKDDDDDVQRNQLSLLDATAYQEIDEEPDVTDRKPIGPKMIQSVIERITHTNIPMSVIKTWTSSDSVSAETWARLEASSDAGDANHAPMPSFLHSALLAAGFKEW